MLLEVLCYFCHDSTGFVQGESRETDVFKEDKTLRIF